MVRKLIYVEDAIGEYTIGEENENSVTVIGQVDEKKDAILFCAAPEMMELLQSLVASLKTTLRVGYERIIDLGGDCDSPEVMIKGHWEIARVEDLLKTLK